MAAKTALTEKGLERMRAAPAAKRVEKFDRLAPGLAVRVSDRGRKSWIAHFRFDGQTRKMALGDWPAMGVESARTEMQRVRELAQAGVDPRQQRERDREQERQQAAAQDAELQTFSDLAEQYIARECRRLKRGHEIESVIRRRLIPAWGDRAITTIRKRDAIRLTDALVDEDHHAAALKLHEVVKRVFRWAAQRDEIEVTPFQDWPPPTEKTRRQHVLSHAEMRVLWQAWTQQGYPMGSLAKLLLLTGVRRGEAATMEWCELDSVEAPTRWVVPGAKTKSKRDFLVPLPRPARELVAELPRFGGPHVFTTTGGERPVSGFSKGKDRAHELANCIADDLDLDRPRPFRWHDLRRTVRTELPRLGVSEDVAERVLDHAKDPLTATYNVYRYEAEKVDALERWGAEVVRIAEGGDPGGNDEPAPSNVVHFR